MQSSKVWRTAGHIRTVAMLVLIFMFAGTACGPSRADCSQEATFCVGLVTAFEGIEDHGLNRASWETLRAVETQAQIARLDYIESVDARDWEKNILFFADNHYDVIVTVGTGLGEAMHAVAADYPGITFIGVDQELAAYPDNVATIDFLEERAGFLAGMLAAMVSPSGKVGAVCETSGIEPVWQYCEGFRAGALFEMDEIEVTVVYRDSGDRDKTFNDPEWGREQALSLIEAGVDTISGFGGNTAQGAFLTASENDVLVIGSDGDLYFRVPALQPALVTSVINDPRARLASLVYQASQGQPVSGPHAGQVAYAPVRNHQFVADRELRSKLEDAQQKIRDGEIEIGFPENQ